MSSAQSMAFMKACKSNPRQKSKVNFKLKSIHFLFLPFSTSNHQIINFFLGNSPKKRNVETRLRCIGFLLKVKIHTTPIKADKLNKLTDPIVSIQYSLHDLLAKFHRIGLISLNRFSVIANVWSALIMKYRLCHNQSRF